MKTLKQEDQAKLEAFILRAVGTNIKIPVQGTGTVTQSLTVQDLVHNCSIRTLDNFYKFLGRLPKSTGSSRRGTQHTYYIGDITAEELSDVIDIIIHMREVAAAQAENASKIKVLQDELEAMATPAERKENIQKQLAELQGKQG